MWRAKQWCNQGFIASLVVLVVSIAAATFLFLNRQFVVDQLSVWQYRPSEAVSGLAHRASMSDKGEFYFYATQPTIESAQTFNEKCAKKEENTAILGCYNGRNIFIYDVTDPKLDGIREVTAAHEMLHAAYDRLSGNEKDKINALLEVEYEKLKSNAEFAERMAFYARTEPGERANELHSIVGTEVASISPELEVYYKKYFDNRSALVALHEKYASVFLALQKRSDEIARQLEAMAASIDAQSASYNSAISQLNNDITAFNAKSTSGGFTSQAQFQAERNALLARARQLEQTRSAINALISHYNELRKELETIASQSEALNRSINSSLAPAPNL